MRPARIIETMRKTGQERAATDYCNRKALLFAAVSTVARHHRAFYDSFVRMMYLSKEKARTVNEQVIERQVELAT